MRSDDSEEENRFIAMVFGKPFNMKEIAQILNFDLAIQDRSYRFRTYKMCFVGEEAVRYMLAKNLAHDTEEAVGIGNMLMNWGAIEHVADKKVPFKNGYFFYRFVYTPNAKIKLEPPQKVFLASASAKNEVNEDDVMDITNFLKSKLEIVDRNYQFKTYPKCFVGSDAVDLMVKHGYAFNEYDAERIGNLLMSQGVFHHVLREQAFKNGLFFYRFASDDSGASHGKSDQSLTEVFCHGQILLVLLLERMEIFNPN